MAKSIKNSIYTRFFTPPVFLLDDLDLKKDVMEADSMSKKIQILLTAIGPKEIPLGPFLPTLRF